MRLLSSLLGVCLFLGVSSAEKKSPEQRFNEFHQLSKSSPSLQLKETSYKSLTSSPRDYSVAVLLTALDARFGCQLCREFQPEWDLLAKSWYKGDEVGESRLLFGSLDFENGKDVFASVRPESECLIVYVANDAEAWPSNCTRRNAVPSHRRTSRCVLP